METYTIPQIVEQRICIAPMTKEEFEKFKQKVTEFYGKDEPELEYLGYGTAIFYRIYPSIANKNNIIFTSSKDYSLSEDYEIKASKTIEFSQIDFEENKVENPNDLIGRKMAAFKFPDIYKCGYADSIERYGFIGRQGEIVKYFKEFNSYSVVFGNGTCYNFPAELIHLHLVDEETEVVKNGIMKIHSEDSIKNVPNKLDSVIEEIKSKQEPEELDLTKILIEGETYYSPICGYCKYRGFNGNRPRQYQISVKSINNEMTYKFSKDGFYREGTELLLFPSKEIRTWENYSPFKKGDLVLFYDIKDAIEHIGLYFGMEKGKYVSGVFKKGVFTNHCSWKNCERFDKSKFNF